MAAFLRQVSGRKIDGDVLVGKPQANRVEGVAYPLRLSATALSGRPTIAKAAAPESPVPGPRPARLDTDKSERRDLAVHSAPDIFRP